MIRLKQLLHEKMDLADRLKDWEVFAPDASDIIELLGDYKLVEDIANQFGESIDTSKTAYTNSMSGAFSLVWWLRSGKVLKITSLADEAKAAAYARTRPKTNHLVSYYDVRPLTYDGDLLKSYKYAIIADGVRVLTMEERQAWTLLETWFFDTKYTDKQVMELAETELTKSWNERANSPKGRALINLVISQRANIIRDVNKFRIQTFEAHSGNVGIDSNGQFVIFDFWSNSQKTAAGFERRLTKPIDLLTLIMNRPDASGIDTANDPTM